MPKDRSVISPKLLKKLYWTEKLTLKEIGVLFNFSSRTIQIRMHECKVPLRNPGLPGPTITKEELRTLYIDQGLSSRKIAKIYRCAYSTIDNKIRNYGFPIKTLAAAHIKSKRLPFSGDLTEKAYLLGFRVGDLRVRKMYKNSETILIDCGSTKSAQISLIKNLFSSYGRVWISQQSNTGKVQIECGVDNTFSFLLEKPNQIPTWVFKNKTTFYSWLAGFTDAEGSFFISTRNTSHFSLGNYNKKCLLQLQVTLAKSKFRTRLFKAVKKGYTGKDGYSHREDYWILQISRKKDLLRFSKVIKPFLKHKDRINALNSVVNNISTRNLKYGFIGM